MITLKDYLEAINFRITGGSEYQWRCYGDNARYLDCADDDGVGTYSITCIFDSVDQTVYAIELWDYVNDREYRWINPMFVSAHMDACVEHDVDCYESCDERNFIDLDVAGDILAKISKVVKGEVYDERVVVPLDLEDDQLFDLMKLAHERDITLNQMVEELLRLAIEQHQDGLPHITNTDNPVDFPVTKDKKKKKKEK